MNILFCLGIDMNKPGPSVHLLNDIFRCAVERGHKLFIIEKDTSENHNNLLVHENITYVFIKEKPLNKNNFLLRYIENITYVLKCAKEFEKLNGIEMVFVQSNTVGGLYSYYLRKYLNVPVLYNAQDIFPDDVLYVKKWDKRNIVYRMLESIQKPIYNYAGKIITISEDMKKTLIEHGVQKEKIEVVYNWSYDTKKIEIDSCKNEFSEKYGLDNSFKVLYAGNVGKKQNIDVIIEAAKKTKSNKGIQFIIVGDGDADCYKKEVEDMKLNVRFFPLQPSSMAESVYSSADVIIITLKKDIIKTALPSKTATCLRLDKPIIFCIGKESIFGSAIDEYDNTFVIDSDNSDEMVNIINELTTKKEMQNSAYSFFIKNMSNKDNPCIYVQLMEQMRK